MFGMLTKWISASVNQKHVMSNPGSVIGKLSDVSLVGPLSNRLRKPFKLQCKWANCPMLSI